MVRSPETLTTELCSNCGREDWRWSITLSRSSWSGHLLLASGVQKTLPLPMQTFGPWIFQQVEADWWNRDHQRSEHLSVCQEVSSTSPSVMRLMLPFHLPQVLSYSAMCGTDVDDLCFWLYCCTILWFFYVFRSDLSGLCVFSVSQL